jgi:hypothetical protein
MVILRIGPIIGHLFPYEKAGGLQIVAKGLQLVDYDG